MTTSSVWFKTPRMILRTAVKTPLEEILDTITLIQPMSNQKLKHV